MNAYTWGERRSGKRGAQHGTPFPTLRRIKRTVFFLWLLSAALTLRADERFLIARIDVREVKHASADVIRSESRLRAGSTYTEDELREANDRVRRLPFILDASFSLERGTSHGEHVLVITVKETRPLFYLLELVPYLQSRDNLGFIGNDIVLGARWFAGRRDVLHLAALNHESDRPFQSSFFALQAGYTRYGLFNDRAFATINISKGTPRSSGEDPRSTVPGALIGVSLTPTQTLTISYGGVEAGTNPRRSERLLESRLAYNTTNHPYFPSNGSLLSIAPVAAWVDTVDVKRTPVHQFDLGLDAHAARYWPLPHRLIASTTLKGGVLHVRERVGGVHDSYFLEYASTTLSLARAIGPEGRESDRRLELMLRVSTRQQETVPFLPDATAMTSLTWVRRNEWGLLRLGIGYSW